MHVCFLSVDVFLGWFDFCSVTLAAVIIVDHLILDFPFLVTIVEVVFYLALALSFHVIVADLISAFINLRLAIIIAVDLISALSF